MVFGSLALRDLADVALDHVAVTRLIHVADKLHGNLAPRFRFQRQICIANIPILLQSFEHGFVRLHVLERTKLPDGFADHFAVRKTQQCNQERVHIADASRANVQNQDAVLRRFE